MLEYALKFALLDVGLSWHHLQQVVGQTDILLYSSEATGQPAAFVWHQCCDCWLLECSTHLDRQGGARQSTRMLIQCTAKGVFPWCSNLPNQRLTPSAVEAAALGPGIALSSCQLCLLRLTLEACEGLAATETTQIHHFGSTPAQLMSSEDSCSPVVKPCCYLGSR